MSLSARSAPRLVARLARGAAAFALAVALAPACVVRLSSNDEALPNGAITGPAADCAATPAAPPGAPGGAPRVRVTGRVDLQNPDVPRFGWAGNVVEFRFRGADASVRLRTIARTRFSVSVDGAAPTTFFTAPGEQAYVLAAGLDPAAEHSVVAHRDTEGILAAPTELLGVDVPGGVLLPPVERARTMLVLGDSITCGYGNEGEHAQTCTLTPDTESNFLAYASIAARELDADLTTVCYSGKGVYRNYNAGTPEAATEPDPALAPDYLDRVIPDDKELRFDPRTERPAVVIVNLGTNDFLAPIGPVDLPAFEAAYRVYAQRVRQTWPEAHTIFTLSPMLSDAFIAGQPRENSRRVITKVVDELVAAGDGRAYFMELVDQGFRRGMGCDYHPNLTTHRIMADQLVGAVRTKTCW